MKKLLPLLLLFLVSCTTATLSDGNSTVTYKGMKVFSPTVLALRIGNCTVPSVDSNGVITSASEPTPTSDNPPTSSQCKTSEMTVNGVDLKGLMNVVLTTALAIITAVVTGS